MKTLIVCASLLLAADLPAQNYGMAIQQAKRDSAQNAAEQQNIQREAGGSSAAGRSAAAPAAPAPMDPALQATLQNISGLQASFAVVVNSSGDKPDPAQKLALLNNLSQAAQGAKASSNSVRRLADDLSAAMLGQKKLNAAQQIKLARDVHALFNSSHLSATQQQALLGDVQKTLADAGASVGSATDVVTDLKAVVSETK